MTEQEKREDSLEEGIASAEGGAAEAKEAEQAKGAEDAPQPLARKEEAKPSARAVGGERRSARPEQGAAHAGPERAVVAPRRPRGQGQPLVSRRRILQIGFWSSVGAIIAGTVAGGLDLLYPREVRGFGGTVAVNASDVPPPGGKLEVPEGRFWLVNLTQEQGGPGLLALWWKCPHLGCTVPWREKFVWPDPTTGAPKEGWFRCPCHGSTFTDVGILVFGPSSRPMDTMEVVVEEGSIIVDTGKITDGGPDNPDRAVRI